MTIIGDEDTVTGFLMGGIGELSKERHPNFFVGKNIKKMVRLVLNFRWWTKTQRRKTSKPTCEPSWLALMWE